MPQMMPIYWLMICLLVNVFIFFFSSSYYYSIFVYSFSISERVSKKDFAWWSLIK